MAVLTNERDAPADLREKSLRLAAHLLEYDPQLRGGAGYARARELLDSGAALKKMQEIIDAQGPSKCRNDIGKLTFDVRAADDGAISEIDCLQLNREPRAHRSTRARASSCSARSAIASRRASRSIEFTPMTSPSSILP
jgi:thymidine phosphorylase